MSRVSTPLLFSTPPSFLLLLRSVRMFVFFLCQSYVLSLTLPTYVGRVGLRKCKVGGHRVRASTYQQYGGNACVE